MKYFDEGSTSYDNRELISYESTGTKRWSSIGIGLEGIAKASPKVKNETFHKTLESFNPQNITRYLQSIDL